jgi:adenylylsulfate kinase
MNGLVIWLTGLPCAGKSTLARALAEYFSAKQLNCEVLDGDVVRKNLSHGLGFTREDRDINVKRIGFVAGLLARNNVAVIVAAVSPYREAREQVRKEVGRFVEVFVDCPLEECERRDVKGMYAQARAGQRTAFTGVDDPYEPPLAPEVTVRTGQESAADSVSRILQTVERLGYLKA